jgi:signal transduction histidine kinase
MSAAGPFDRSVKAKIVAAYVVAYVVLDWISYIHPIAVYGITPWNPQPGLSLALLLLYGLRYAPALFLAAAAAEIVVRGLAGSPLIVVVLPLTLMLGYTGLAAALRKPLGFDPRLSSLRDLSVFCFAAVLGTMLVALGYILAHRALGLITWETFVASFQRFWVGDLIGVVVTTPFLLLHADALAAWRSAMRAPSIEVLWQALALVGTPALLLFLGERDASKFFYVVFLPLVWVGVRHGIRGASLALLVVQIGLIVVAQLSGYSASTLVELQLFMVVLAFGTLFLGMAVSERQRSQTALIAREVELRDKQADLERALRYAAAGEMASALAHELNQPLSAVASYLRACELMIRQPLEHRERLAETLSEAAAEARRAGGVVKELREFFRSGAVQLEAVGVRDLVQRALEPLRDRVRRHAVDLRTDFEADLPQIYVDRVQIETVLHNLIGNAIDAMTSADCAVRSLSIEAARQDARFVRVSVRDTGPGITAEIAARIFQPFKTTKPHGMGLGLALSRSIVEGHGGRLWYEPADSGARFEFTLPVAEENP